MDVKKQITELRETLNKANKEYYDLDSPTISDFEYDEMLRKLEELELSHPELKTPDSPTMHVGGKVSTQFTPVQHEVPLESLSDVFSYDELQNFTKRIFNTNFEHIKFDAEPKIDGLSVAVEYIDGYFYRGATRGDGITGEDVTENLRTIKSLPKKINNAPPRLIVRGEVYMSHDTFSKLNAEREIIGKKLFANPRNAAAGSLRQLDSKIAAERNLDIIIFNVQLAENMDFTSHVSSLDILEEMGFPVVPHVVCQTFEQCKERVIWMGENREEYPYDIDGAVIKLDSLAYRSTLGSTAKAPRWAVAYKYPPEKKESIVRDIVVQVGRTGVLTPKAVIEPIRLAGTTVTNATLHNQDFIDNLDVRIGDTVLVQKAGEIIPEILSVNKKKRPDNTINYQLPKTCPECGAPVTRDEDAAATRCMNPECPAQLLRNIAHFASRDAMDIDGLGISVTEALVNAGFIKTPADLYYLDAQSISTLERMGKKSSENLIAAIDKSKERGLAKLLYAFGIRQVGQKAGKVLATHYETLDDLCNATADDLLNINDIGPITAQSLVEWLQSPNAQHQIKLLREAGVDFNSKQERIDNRFQGETFVLTGSLKDFKRSEAASIIEKYGGKSSSSVSKKTSYVVAGEEAGSKLTKAQSLGITILTEEQFKEMIK